MGTLDNIKLRNKFLLSFIGSGGILVIAMLFLLWQVRGINQYVSIVADQSLPSIEAVSEISQLRLRYRVRSLEFMLAESAAEQEKLTASMNELNEKLSAAFEKYEVLINSQEARQTYQDALAAAQAYRGSVERAVALRRAGQEAEAVALSKKEWIGLANTLRDQTDKLAKLSHQRAKDSTRNTTRSAKLAMNSGVLALLLGLTLAVLLSMLMGRHIGKRLQEANAVAKAIAAGDLRSPLPAPSQDEIGELIAAMASMQTQLRAAMQETRDSASTLLQASEALHHSIHDMERSVNLQSEAASGIAANTEELTQSISHVASSTRTAADLTGQSDEQAGRGFHTLQALSQRVNDVADVISAAATRIAQLQDESSRISSIVSVIREIADQTNLLALNAAIEAARAGEHGRGFAVVADEVRKLSERTAQSTNEISTMVNGIQTSTAQVVVEVSQGVERVNISVRDAENASEIVASLRHMAQQIATIVGDLNSALQQQSAASMEISQRIESVAGHAQDVTLAARDTTRTAQTMESVSRRMQDLVSRFQV